MKNRITLSSPFTGANLTCRCGRVLYWEDIGTDYRAVCCNRVYFEWKRHEPMLPENPSESMLEYWASKSELFERSALPTGVSREC